ncbi:MAG: methyltransferase domain-containing protein [Chloroflexota bacterium]
MFGSCLGRREITALMMEHPQAQRRLSPRMRYLVGRWAPAYVKLFGYPLSVGNRQRTRAVMRLLSPRPGERVLDVGCGIGYYVFELATRHGCEAYGVDLDAHDVALARRIAKALPAPGAHFAVGDGRALEYPANSFDAVLLCEVIEHVREDVALLRDLYRVLVPGGRLAITTPRCNEVVEYDQPKMTLEFPGLCSKQTAEEGEREASGHVRNGYTVDVLEERLSRAGFQLHSSTTILKKFSTLGGRWGMFGFPFGYALSMLDAFVIGPGGSLVALAVRH